MNNNKHHYKTVILLIKDCTLGLYIYKLHFRKSHIDTWAKNQSCRSVNSAQLSFYKLGSFTLEHSTYSTSHYATSHIFI